MTVPAVKAQGARPESGVQPIAASGTPLADYASARLKQLTDAAGFGAAGDDAVAVFRRLIYPWGNRPVSARSEWISEISDDNTPIEFSVAIAGERIEVRALFEPQGATATVESYRIAALELHERLEREFGADLRRFRRVVDLFAPEGMEGPFAIWNSVVFSRTAPPSLKTYFNPQARGAGRASALIEEALWRLGLPNAWSAISHRAARRGPNLDELKYFALDLTTEPHARVKVYVRHHEATPEDLEVACGGHRHYVPGEALHFSRAMRGGPERMTARATFTCSSFIEGDDRPAVTTLYVPVCAYASDDAAIRARVNQYLDDQALPSAAYNRILDGFANRPLESGVGMQSWMALQRAGGDPRITVYLATEANQVFAPGSVPAATGSRSQFHSTSELLDCLAQYPLAAHPVFARMKRERGAKRAASLLARAIAKGTEPLERWVDAVAPRVRRPALVRALFEVASIVVPHWRARTLNDLVDVAEPLHEDVAEATNAIGICLREAAERHLSSADSSEALAALVGLFSAQQEILRVVSDLSQADRGQGDLDADDDQLVIAAVLSANVPRAADALASARRGAFGVHNAFWGAFAKVYDLSFGSPIAGQSPTLPLPFDDF